MLAEIDIEEARTRRDLMEEHLAGIPPDTCLLVTSPTWQAHLRRLSIDALQKGHMGAQPEEVNRRVLDATGLAPTGRDELPLELPWELLRHPSCYLIETAAAANAQVLVTDDESLIDLVGEIYEDHGTGWALAVNRLSEYIDGLPYGFDFDEIDAESALQSARYAMDRSDAQAMLRRDRLTVGAEQPLLLVQDTRTGYSYEIPIENEAIRGEELRKIKVSDDDVGLMTYDPAFMTTAACRSSITYINGDEGVLEYRGYPVTQLAEHSSYVEVAYLLTQGELPSPSTLRLWQHDLTVHSFVHENVKKFMQGFRYDANPMGMLMASVSALSTFYPDGAIIRDAESRYTQTVRLLAKMPTLAAFIYRHSCGMPYVYPDTDLSYTGNLLSMLNKVAEPRYEPDARLEQALDLTFLLTADHEQACSTSAVRCVGSSQADPYSAIAAGVAALQGPLHGGACEAVLRMLSRIESENNISAFVRGVKNGDERLVGFGHRVYKRFDPRARFMKKAADDVLEVTGKSRVLEIATELEKIALADGFFTARNLYPNIDFYMTVIYEALGLPAAMFPVLFAIGRTSGWIAQWLEMIQDPEQKIVRPRQIYAGQRNRRYLVPEPR